MKTPIQELIDLVFQDRSMVDKWELLGWLNEEGLQKEKAFAFDCYLQGVSDWHNPEDDAFNKFYSQYAKEHNK